MSRHHPAADLAEVDGADLADSILRAPPREVDPYMHDALTVASRREGIDPQLGRPTGTIQDTIVEIGSEVRTWTVLSADQAAEVTSARIRAIPLKPPLMVTGNVVLPQGLPTPCVSAHVAAFRDAVAS